MLLLYCGILDRPPLKFINSSPLKDTISIVYSVFLIWLISSMEERNRVLKAYLNIGSNPISTTKRQNDG